MQCLWFQRNGIRFPFKLSYTTILLRCTLPCHLLLLPLLLPFVDFALFHIRYWGTTHLWFHFSGVIQDVPTVFHPLSSTYKVRLSCCVRLRTFTLTHLIEVYRLHPLPYPYLQSLYVFHKNLELPQIWTESPVLSARYFFYCINLNPKTFYCDQCHASYFPCSNLMSVPRITFRL